MRVRNAGRATVGMLPVAVATVDAAGTTDDWGLIGWNKGKGVIGIGTGYRRWSGNGGIYEETGYAFWISYCGIVSGNIPNDWSSPSSDPIRRRIYLGW